MRTRITVIEILVGVVAAGYATTGEGNKKESRRISRQVLEDKIRGGWAGQMIGVSYGAPDSTRILRSSFEMALREITAKRIHS